MTNIQNPLDTAKVKNIGKQAKSPCRSSKSTVHENCKLILDEKNIN